MKMNEFDLAALVDPLVKWYDANKRSMVWRDNPMPYYVWISEIMLQQTRIEAAKAYFIRFTQELPSIEALANVEEEKLMKLWEGLGYYNRARNLQKAAKLVIERYEGQLPKDYDMLMTLPGIGPYTAGAIASIAYQVKAPAVDGNVLRVTMRYLDCDEDIMKTSLRKKVERSLLQVMPERPGDFNQGIMELGEVICIPNGRPLCEICPLAETCKGYQMGTASSLPVKTEKKPRRIEKKTILIYEKEGKIGIVKRPTKGLLAGLWEFPCLEQSFTLSGLKKELKIMKLDPEDIITLEEGKHIFSHIEWHMLGYHIMLPKESLLPQDICFVSRDELIHTYTLPTAFRNFIDQIR